jgi:hypothetical protein
MRGAIWLGMVGAMLGVASGGPAGATPPGSEGTAVECRFAYHIHAVRGATPIPDVDGEDMRRYLYRDDPGPAGWWLYLLSGDPPQRHFLATSGSRSLSFDYHRLEWLRVGGEDLLTSTRTRQTFDPASGDYRVTITAELVRPEAVARFTGNGVTFGPDAADLDPSALQRTETRTGRCVPVPDPTARRP